MIPGISRLLAREAGVNKGRRDRLGTLNRGAALSNCVEPGAVALFSHIRDDFLSILALKWKASVLRVHIYAVGYGGIAKSMNLSTRMIATRDGQHKARFQAP